MPEQSHNSQRLQHKCRSFLETAARMCSRHDFLRDIEKDLYSVAGKVTHPFNVAVAARVHNKRK